ncbi:MAG: hypothetical protein AAGD05_10810, partial [Bacteroidota bacterium]
LILLIGWVIYLAWYVDTALGIYLLPIVIALVALYIFQPQIDWWWYNRYPPDLDAPLQRLFEAKLPFYQGLAPQWQLRFRRRCALYMIANDFIPKGPETVPEDLKGLVAANIVQLTFGQIDYRLSRFERIVVYLTPFPSPQYQAHLHSSEIFIEDGVLLFAADHLLPSTLEPQRYFNIGLYEYAKVFRISYPDYAYPSQEQIAWPILEQVSGFTQKKIEEFVGLPDLDQAAVAIALFFSFPKSFLALLPEATKQYQLIFNQDPTLENCPVIKQDKLDLAQI